MRDIKFRAWCKATEHMMQVTEDNILFILRHGNEYILMQYTGLKDKNGKKIWEGDIVRLRRAYFPWIYEEKDQKPLLNDESICTIEIENLTAYAVEKQEADTFYLAWIMGQIKHGRASIEVIGNIYENPELIQEADK